MSTHSMITRSMTKTAVKTESSQRNKKVNTSPIPRIKHETTSKAKSAGKISPKVQELKDVQKITKPLADILTSKELELRGLKPNETINGTWRKVIPASELDILVTASRDVRDKWAVAPDGWYWKAFSEKNYYWFDWYELRRIP